IYGTEKVLFKSHKELKLLVNQWLSRSDDVRSNALNQIRQHIMTQKLSIQDQIDHVMREL
ncbi:MAG: hypothetical protein VW418_06120, partial [Gammaproteobacteria bacterium]